MASLVAAMDALYLPIAQPEQASDSKPDPANIRYFPAGQGVQEEEENPGAENLPSPHGEHAKDSSPMVALMRCFPAAQVVQEREPGPE